MATAVSETAAEIETGLVGEGEGRPVGGSEHSNETENVERGEVGAAVYEEYRRVLAAHGVGAREQQLVFKAFESKAEQDVRLFIQ